VKNNKLTSYQSNSFPRRFVNKKGRT